MSTDLMKDSIEHLANDFNKSPFTERRGKLIKDHHHHHGLKSFASPTSSHRSVPTIPSKYLTVITESNEQKGFQRSSKRFQYNPNDTPGPGSYGDNLSLNEKLKKTSDSKKGYGNFASSSSRYQIKLNPSSTPGAGTYNTHSSTILSKKDFSTGHSSVFQKPIAQKVVKENEMPGPSEYDIEKAKKVLFKTNNVCADSAFKSNTKREFINLDKSNEYPAPGTYNVKDDMAHESTKIPFSSFKSTSQRHTFIANNNLPGPGDYKPYEPMTENINRQLFPRRHYLAISAPAVPMAPELPLPGPGAYEVRDFKEPEKKYMSSAVFVSSTGRWLNAATNSTNIPGPANYFPLKVNKQSFHYNYSNKWI